MAKDTIRVGKQEFSIGVFEVLITSECSECMGWRANVTDAKEPGRYDYYKTDICPNTESAKAMAEIWLKKNYPSNRRDFTIRYFKERGYIGIVKKGGDVVYRTELFRDPVAARNKVMRWIKERRLDMTITQETLEGFDDKSLKRVRPKRMHARKKRGGLMDRVVEATGIKW